MGAEPEQHTPRPSANLPVQQPSSAATVGNFTPITAAVSANPQPQQPKQPLPIPQITSHNSQANKHSSKKPIVILAIMFTLAVIITGGYYSYSKLSHHRSSANQATSPSSQSEINSTSNPSVNSSGPTSTNSEGVPNGTDNPNEVVNSSPGLKSSTKFCTSSPYAC